MDENLSRAKPLLSVPELEAQLTELAGHLNTAHHRWLTLIAEFDHRIVVHVDEATLRESVAGRCELEESPAIAAETARRLACDSSVVRLLENEKGEPLDIGRKTR